MCCTWRVHMVDLQAPLAEQYNHSHSDSPTVDLDTLAPQLIYRTKARPPKKDKKGKEKKNKKGSGGDAGGADGKVSRGGGGGGKKSRKPAAGKEKQVMSMCAVLASRRGVVLCKC